MFDEEDLLPVSALQHFVFCPRRCALVHIEQVWMENQFTVELIFYTMSAEVVHSRLVAISKTA
jgi:hypothetical protein